MAGKNTNLIKTITNTAKPKRRRINGSMAIFALLIIFFIYYSVTTYLGDASVAKSTHIRSELKTESVEFKENDSMYNDETAAQAGENLSYIEESLDTFYIQTGVQPYLYILSDDERQNSQVGLDAFAKELYNERTIIRDEAHFLVVYQNNAASDDNAADDQDTQSDTPQESASANYYVSLVVGADAASVMDDEACQIFRDYTDKYYTESGGDTASVFYSTFQSTASRIMGGSSTLAIIILAVVIVLLIALFFVRYRVLRSQNETSDPSISSFKNI